MVDLLLLIIKLLTMNVINKKYEIMEVEVMEMSGLSDVIKDILKLCEVKAGERTVLYTGQEYDKELLDEYTVALKSLGADFLRVIAPTWSRDGELVNVGGEPLACKLFEEAEMVFYVLPPNPYWGEGIPRVAPLHTPQFRTVVEKNPTLRWLQVGLPQPEINYRRLFPTRKMIKRSRAGSKVMGEAKEIRLTSKNGTDFTCNKEGGAGEYQIGIVTKDHTWDNYGCGNVSTNPIQNTAQGTIVVSPGDHWHHPNSPEALSIVREPIVLTFEDGLITKLEGGAEVRLIKRALEQSNNSSGLMRVAHIGWGTHEGGVWLDNRLFNVADWEGTYGSIMVHFGGYKGLGGSHFSGPTMIDTNLYLDGKPVIEDNQIVHPDCK
jgi:hypothetical protein